MSFGARQYDPQIGRFLGIDPMAVLGGQDSYSPYAAMGNRPESAVDPNGLQPSMANYSPHTFERINGGGADGTGGGSPGSGGTWGQNVFGDGDLVGAFSQGSAEEFAAYVIEQNCTPVLDKILGTGNYRVGANGSVVFTATGGSDDATAGGKSGFTREQVRDASNYILDGEDEKYYHVHYWTSDLKREGALLLKADQTQDGDGDVSTSGIGITDINSIFANGTFVAWMGMSIMDTKTGKVIAMGGSYVFKSSSFAAQRGLIAEAAMAGKGLEIAGNTMGGIGLFLTGVDIYSNGLN